MKNLYTLIAVLTLITSPSHANIIILKGLTNQHSANPGEIVKGEVLLYNTSNGPLHATLSAKDVLFYCNSSRVFKKNSQHKFSASDWLKISFNRITIAPKQVYTLSYKMIIPADPELKGSFWTALMIDQESALSESDMQGGIKVKTKLSYAVGIVTQVSTPESLDLTFESISFKKRDHKIEALALKVHNNDLFVRPVKLEMEVYDSLGSLVSEVSSSNKRMFSQVCTTYELKMEHLKSGLYTAVIYASDNNQKIGTNIQFNIK